MNALQTSVNALNSNLSTKQVTYTPVISDADVTEYAGRSKYYQSGNVVTLYFGFKIENASARRRKIVSLNIPSTICPHIGLDAIVSDGTESGYTVVALKPSGDIDIYPTKSGTTYAIGFLTYVV